MTITISINKTINITNTQ